MRFLQKRENSAKPSPPQTNIFQKTFGYIASAKYSCTVAQLFPATLNLEFGAHLCNSWTDYCYTFVKQLSPCTVAQSSGWVIKHFKSKVQLKIFCSTTNCPACRSIQWDRMKWHSSRGFVIFCKTKNGKNKRPPLPTLTKQPNIQVKTKSTRIRY